MPILSRVLGAIHRHKFWGWCGFLVYAALVTFPHQTVQYYANEIAIHYTHQRLYEGSAAVGAVLVGAVNLVLLLRLRRHPARRTLAIAWLVTMLLTAGAWSGLTANNTEFVHYPQYFPEGAMLLALTGSPVEAVAWATLFGGLDESFQYSFLVNNRPVPYDFNDIFMDLAGAAAGVVFAMAFLPMDRRKTAVGWLRETVRRPGVLAVIGVLTAGVVLWASGLMVLYEAPGAPPHWFSLSRQTKLPFWFSVDFLGPRKFHELSPLEGPIVVLAGLGIYALLDRRVKLAMSPVSTVYQPESGVRREPDS